MLERFWSKVNKSGGPDACWPWLKGKTKSGHGQFRYKGKTIGAYVYSWIEKNGEVPEGFYVLHKCNNPPCVNEKHLKLGTAQDNSDDMVIYDRQKKGIELPQSKLTETQVTSIREEYVNGNGKILADKYNVSLMSINRIVNNVTWKHLKGKEVAKIFEVRYRNKNKEIVAHQHASEHYAKIDAKAISKEFGSTQLAEIDIEADRIYRVVEFAGGVQGKWENRSGGINHCKVVLTLEDTKRDEPEVAPQAKVEMSDEERAERKAALARLREANEKKATEKKAASGNSSTTNEKREKLVAEGLPTQLIDLLLQSGIHYGSPNHNWLCKLFNNGPLDVRDYADVTPRQLNTIMMNLRGLLMQNNTGKSIASYGSTKEMKYKLIDFKVVEVDEEVA